MTGISRGLVGPGKLALPRGRSRAAERARQGEDAAARRPLRAIPLKEAIVLENRRPAAIRHRR